MASPLVQRQERTCLECGGAFVVGGRAGSVNKVHCSRSCAGMGNKKAAGHGHPHTDSSKELISQKLRGNKNAVGHGRHPGYCHTAEYLRHMSERMAGKNNPAYIDGKGRERANKRNQDRHNLDYRLWRVAVFERDQFTCQICGDSGVELHADHIKGWAEYPDLRFDLANGRTLCAPCHRGVTHPGVNAKEGVLFTL